MIVPAIPFRRLLDEPLRDPILIAAWPGMGMVGLRAVEYLRTQFPGEPVAEVEVGPHFPSTGIQVENGLVQLSRGPIATLHRMTPRENMPDIILHLGEAQPLAGQEEPLADLVIEAATRLGIKTVYTAAALATNLTHREPSRVWGIATDSVGLEELKRHQVSVMTEGHIGGMNGVLLRAAIRRSLRGYCLLGEIPYYTTQIESPKASKVIVERLASIFGFVPDMSDLDRRAAEIEDQIDRYLARMGQEQQHDPESGPEGTPERGPIN